VLKTKYKNRQKTMLKTKYKKWQKIMLRSKCQIVETTCKNNLQKQWQYNRKYGIMSL